MAQPRRSPGDEDLEFELPALDIEHPDDGSVAEEAGALALHLPEDGHDPYDDEVAHDLPIEIELQTDHEEPSVIGDDALGVGSDAHAADPHATEQLGADLGVGIEETGASWTGPEMEAGGFEDEDQSLGIDVVPRETDDGGLDGVIDPASEQVDEHAFPPLDGADDDEEHGELDVGIHVEAPAGEPEG